jgi:hypothetical protein
MSTFVNAGMVHGVKCEWCGLKMACNCWDGNDPNREGHVIVLCPRCQVTDLTNMIFGEKMLREILFSKIEQSKERTERTKSPRPGLRIVARNEDQPSRRFDGGLTRI